MSTTTKAPKPANRAARGHHATAHQAPQEGGFPTEPAVRVEDSTPDLAAVEASIALAAAGDGHPDHPTAILGAALDNLRAITDLLTQGTMAGGGKMVVTAATAGHLAAIADRLGAAHDLVHRRARGLQSARDAIAAARGHYCAAAHVTSDPDEAKEALDAARAVLKLRWELGQGLDAATGGLIGEVRAVRREICATERKLGLAGREGGAR